MNQINSQTQILLPAIQRIVKLFNQPNEPAITLVNLLGLLSGQSYVNQSCLLMPNKFNGLYSIVYSAGVLTHETKRLEEQINQEYFRSQLSETQSASPSPAYKELFSQYDIPSEKCLVTEEIIGIPISLSHSVTALFIIFTDKDLAIPLDTILHLMCISSVLLRQLMQAITPSSNKLHTEESGLVVNKPDTLQDFIQYGILGKSPALQDALKTATRAAQSQASVMLLGESGTGKEKFARMIHNMSDRGSKPFVAINCAAIPENLLESELFGYEKGSFTGATQTRTGKFEVASGGTLFLDEIGDMSLELQSKLLRVLQESVIQRIGGRDEIPVDVRIITATHRNMQVAVNNNQFRLDLFYRLNVIKIKLPPLRDRREDVGLLSRYFWNLHNEKRKVSISLSEDAIRKLEKYHWPGNIRQLENLLERAAVMSDGDTVSGNDIENILRDESHIDPASFQSSEQYIANQVDKISYYKFDGVEDNQNMVRPYYRVTDEEKDQIVKVLKSSRGNKTYAAKKLGLTPRQLHYRMEKLKINV